MILHKIIKIEGVCWTNYFKQFSNLQLYYSYTKVTESINKFLKGYYGIYKIYQKFIYNIQMAISQ